MRLAAVVLGLSMLPMAAKAGPFDGRWSLSQAPGQCERRANEVDGYARFTAISFDQYEAHCGWGRLTRRGAGLWTAQGRCSVEGDVTRGAFKFRVRGGGLTMHTPDGIASDFRRCPTR